jgi:ferredoxin
LEKRKAHISTCTVQVGDESGGWSRGIKQRVLEEEEEEEEEALPSQYHEFFTVEMKKKKKKHYLHSITNSSQLR